MDDVRIRPVESRDAGPARQLIEREVAGTSYTEMPGAALRDALSADSSESRGMVAESGGELLGIALFGWVAGTVRTAQLHLVAVTAAARLRGVGTRLCNAVAEMLFDEGARLIVVEVPDDPALRPGLSLLLRAGWREESRVENYYRENVALLLLRREPIRPPRSARVKKK